MDNILELTLLFDYYGELLTSKQKETFDMYYNQDLSLQEISDFYKISRQTVHSNIKTCEKKLFQFEKSLGLLEKRLLFEKEIGVINDDITKLVQLLDNDKVKKLGLNIIEKIEDLKIL